MDEPIERRPSKFAAFVFVFSLIPPTVLIASVVWPIVFKPDFGVGSVIAVVCPWSGALFLSGIAVLLALIALIRTWRNPELRGRAVGSSALAMGMLGAGMGLLPVVAFVLACIGAVVALFMALSALAGVSVSGRPLGPQATGLRHHLASSRSVWRARAHDEARSVDAFEAIARDLERLGAPRSLVERAEDAARDEARHADIAARRAGGAVLPGRLPLPAPLDRHTFVERTILEGCLGEALAAEVLAAEGEDDIARDEARHAQLAWDIVAWAGPVDVPLPWFAAVPSRRVGLVTQLRMFRRLRRDAKVRLAGLERAQSGETTDNRLSMHT
ncbi:MAG: hypothetical protein R3F61_02455 [Myxococcota bacterium]